MARKLVTIQKIKEISPIEGADNIESTRIENWNCVIPKKYNFKVGDLVVYAEIDSLFPKRPEFEFLKDTNYRIRTKKFRGAISQGLVFPMSILEGLKHEDDVRENPIYDFKEGEDVTGLLGVVLYQPPIPAQLMGKMKGGFPSFLVKSDQTRVEVLEGLLKRHAGTMCFISEKLDGSSGTYFLNRGEFGVCSRNLELYETEGNTFWEIAKKFDIENKLRKLGRNIALQGEVFGEGIGGNPLKIKGHDIRFFDVFDIDIFKYLDFGNFINMLRELDLKSVPILSELHVMKSDAKYYIDAADGESIINSKVLREGIVVKPLIEMMDMEMAKSFGNGRISFKAVSRNFLVGEKT